MAETEFVPGDILIHGGETYQVLENRGDHGLVIPFPSEITQGTRLAWDEDGQLARRIGNEPLPAPSPCSATGCCPTNGNALREEDVFGRRS